MGALALTGKAARSDWLSSTGKSALIDTCAETSVSYLFDAKTTVRLVAKFHRCEYFPVVRDDAESIIGPGLTYNLSRTVSCTVDLVRDRAWNNIDSLSDRQFHRTLLTLAATIQL